MYVKRNASYKPPPATDHPKKDLPKCEVVSKSTVLWKGPNISTHFASMISIPLLIFLLYYMLKTPPSRCGSFAQFKRNYLFPKKFCVTNSKFRNLKKAILYSLLFNIWYTILCVCFVCSMFARKEVLFSVSMFLHIDVPHWCHSQRGSCHPWKKMAQRENKSCSQRWKTHLKKRTSFTLNIE